MLAIWTTFWTKLRMYIRGMRIWIKRSFCYVFLGITGITLSCTYNELPGDSIDTDESLFYQLQETGYSYYQGGQVLSPASASPHGNFRLRFNEIAWNALDASGKLPNNASFPEGSVIVKEVITGNAITVLAVIKKSRSDVNSANGWLWAELSPTGDAYFSINNRGSGCTSCHGDTPNRDFVRTFDLH